MLLSINDLHQIFSGGIEYILFLNDDGLWKVSPRCCDCDSILLKTRNSDRLICIECENGALVFKEASPISLCKYNLKHTPPENTQIPFVSAESNEHGFDGIKFKYCDGYLFIFADEDGWLTITISKWDIFEEDTSPMPDYDNLELHLQKI